MPWAIPMIAAGAVSTAGAVISSRAQSKSADKALASQEAGNAEVIAFEREREQRRREEWDRVMEMERAQWEAEQARREPYRQMSRGALSELGRHAGISTSAPERPMPNFDRPMPADWQPGDPTGTDRPAPGPSVPPEEQERPELALTDTPDLGAPILPEAPDPRARRVSEEAYRPLARRAADMTPEERAALRTLPITTLARRRPRRMEAA